MPAAGVVCVRAGLTRITCLLAGAHGKNDAGVDDCCRGSRMTNCAG
jgi:hypothetical protein